MRWQKVARLVMALVVIGCGVLVYMQLRTAPEEQEATDTSSTAGVAPLKDPTVISTTKMQTLRKVDADGEEVYAISGDELVEYADQRSVVKGNVVARFRRNGVLHEVKADEAERSGSAGPTGAMPALVHFRGNVRLSTEAGEAVEAVEEAVYDDIEQKITIPGRMRFTRGRLSGRGVGAELFMDRSVLWILAEAELDVADDDPAKPPVQARASKIGLAEADHFMVLEGHAVLTQQQQRLAADNSKVYFSDDNRLVIFIELRGRSSVTSTVTSGSRPNLEADDINLGFAQSTGVLANTRLSGNAVATVRENGATTRISGSDLEMFVGPDGETLTRLETTAPTKVQIPASADRPARTITSQTLLAEGEPGKGLTRAVFTGDVAYEEIRPGSRGAQASTRTASSRSLALGLGGDLATVTTALFNGNFRVVDGAQQGRGDEGVYDTQKETLQLRSAAGGKQPSLSDGEVDVTANEIDGDLKTDGLHARGAVSFFRKAAASKNVKSGMFEAGKDITATSETLKYDKAARTASFTGKAFIVQGTNSLRANQIDLDDARGDLKATGAVTSRMTIDNVPGATTEKPGSSAPSQITAAQLVYTDASRRATYSGGAELTAPGGDRLRSEQLILNLAAEGRSLVSVEATAKAGGEVRVTLPEGRQAVGSKVTYDAKTEYYVVTGTPALSISPAPDREPGDCSVTTGTEWRFSRRQNAFETTNTGGAVGRAQVVKCATVIK
jgi:lipopolysaccharide export system protein LptA